MPHYLNFLSKAGAVLSLSIILAACGGEDDESSSSDTGGESGATTGGATTGGDTGSTTGGDTGSTTGGDTGSTTGGDTGSTTGGDTGSTTGGDTGSTTGGDTGSTTGGDTGSTTGGDTGSTTGGETETGIGELIWEDNFNTFNSTIWTKDVGDGCDQGLCGWGNQELQSYEADNANVALIPGEGDNYALKLSARNEQSGSRSFTSGKVNSADKLAIQYGMIETRIRIPDLNSGLWPAAWLLGTSNLAWPRKGEIDMMEMGHSAEDMARQEHEGANSNNYVGSNLIFYADAACVPGNETCAASTAYEVADNKPYVAEQSMADRFVIYRTYWTESEIRFTITDNGVEYDLYETPFQITDASDAFRAPFFLLLNLAVGGTFTGDMDNNDITAPMPADMYIDYVRVYKYDGQGEIILGSVAEMTADSLGVFTDTTETDRTLSSEIFLWDPNSSEGDEPPFEGGNVLSWSFDNPNQWFGAGIQAIQEQDLSLLEDGFLKFRIKIPADIDFRIGISDKYTNENWLVFPANTTQYGLTRNGEWGEVSIPASDLRGSLIALQSLKDVFAISSNPEKLPDTTFTYAIDDIYWTIGDSEQGNTGDGGANEPSNDDDQDGVINSNDECPGTPANIVVSSNGCPAAQEVSFANDRLVGGEGSSQPGFTLYTFANDVVGSGSSACTGNCANAWPPLLVGDNDNASGIDGLGEITRNDGSKQVTYNGSPLYFYSSDTSSTDTLGNNISGWSTINFGTKAEVVSLYNKSTVLEADSQWETDEALVTRFSDRPRTRHAKEDQFQSYDHYVKFYFEHRSTNIEIIDRVAKGGDTITMNVRTLWTLDDLQAENRWWYWGQTTIAQYAGNGVMAYLGFYDGYHHYTKTDNENRQYKREIQMGDRLEFEVSQFNTEDIPRGQENYYGTTFLYIVGKGIVPWYTENTDEFVEGREPFQEDSREIPEEFWLGGNTTLHYQYTDEPDNHFMQMATNMGYDNAQKFLLGRRVHHSSTIDGTHDEDAENGVLNEVVNLTQGHYVNKRCTDCHERNGSAPVAENSELLDRWVFKIGDENGDPDPAIGRVLQPSGVGTAGEGEVSIASWTETADGLRAPNYQFSKGRPAQFSARIAPRLVGLGLLEAINEDDVLALEDPNDSNNDGISGRAHLVQDPENAELTRLGRFGWKAGTSSVKHQVAAALNTDMGVMTSLLSSPDCGAEQDDCIAGAPMPDEQFDNLVSYISTLGVRAQRGWKTGFEEQAVINGKQVFKEINCTGCHTETFQTSEFHPLAEVRNQTIHPYSDLLLHDMGDGLADSLAEGSASGREWRTTPLWGLGLSACVTGGVTNPTGNEGDEICTPHHAYLHDGRARTIDEAIRWHGGESQASNDAYQSLSDSDRNDLIKFLEAL